MLQAPLLKLEMKYDDQTFTECHGVNGRNFECCDETAVDHRSSAEIALTSEDVLLQGEVRVLQIEDRVGLFIILAISDASEELGVAVIWVPLESAFPPKSENGLA